MRAKLLIIGSTVLFVESLCLLASSTLQKSGQAFGLATETFSNVTFILITIFIVTLIALLIALRFVSTSEMINETHKNDTVLSWKYLTKSLDENKNEKQILSELERGGYRKHDVENFLSEWEEKEEAREKQRAKLNNSVASVKKKLNKRK